MPHQLKKGAKNARKYNKIIKKKLIENGEIQSKNKQDEKIKN